MKRTTVLLPDETYRRLQEMTAKTGRAATLHIREALEAHLDDLEDLYLAEQAIERRNGVESRTVSLDELDRELGLDD